MKVATIVVLLSAVTMSLAATEGTSRPQVTDDVLEGALSDKRYLMRQLKCALSEGPCDSVGRRLKSLAPLVLRGACPQCSPSETKQIQRTLSHIQRHYPKEWAKVLRQYAGI